MNAVCTGVSEQERKDIVDSICGKLKPPVDVEVLCAMSCLDPENSQAFEKLKKMAMESLETTLWGSAEKAAQAANKSKEEVQHQMDRKVPEFNAAHQAEKKSSNEKQYDLTPADLKELLPSTAGVRGLFWMRYHPTEKWFRTTYPSCSLALVWNWLLFPAESETRELWKTLATYYHFGHHEQMIIITPLFP